MWARMRERIGGLFSRRHQDREEDGAGETVDARDERSESGGAVSPPNDFTFPWTRSGAEAPSPVGETFRSVDDALPASSELSGTADVPAATSKDGFLARMFGKPEKEALELEVHEDRIDAAAKALDRSEEQFESFDGKSNTADKRFASVDDALPAPEPLPLIYEPIAAPAPELEPLVLSPASSPPEAAKQTENAEDTDEFEIVPIDDVGAQPEKDVNGDTLEVERTSFWSKSFIGRLFRPGETEVETVGAKDGEAARASAVFLFSKFRAFYNEVIRFQHQKDEFTAGFATAMMTDASDAGPDATPEGTALALSHRLSELLDLQAAEAKWMGGEASERYPNAQYAMAALADEIFTYSEWDGQSAWPKSSLEFKMYKSRSADVELFKRIDTLLKESPDSAIARDLARVYLLVLAAGFQGKWRPFSLTRPLSEYRRRLYEYIHGADPLLLYAPERKVFPDAEARTLEGAAVSRYSGMQRWAAILVILVVTYAAVAHVAWSRASADLKDVTTRIKANSTAGAP